MSNAVASTGNGRQRAAFGEQGDERKIQRQEERRSVEEEPLLGGGQARIEHVLGEHEQGGRKHEARPVEPEAEE